MTGRRRETSIGGPQRAFQTTRWSEVLNARTLDPERRRLAVDRLIRRYWKPVYCYLSYKGYDNEQAKDLAQGFFHEVVLGRDLIQHADSAKGKFRSFLLLALERYATSMYRKETARKRSPQGGLAYIEDLSIPEMAVAPTSVSPEQMFQYTWATELIDQVLSQVKEDYCGTGRENHWNVFVSKLLEPMTDEVPEPSLSEIRHKYGIENERQVSNMVITVKRRFAVVFRNKLRQYVRSDSEVDREFADLLAILGECG